MVTNRELLSIFYLFLTYGVISPQDEEAVKQEIAHEGDNDPLVLFVSTLKSLRQRINQLESEIAVMNQTVNEIKQEMANLKESATAAPVEEVPHMKDIMLAIGGYDGKGYLRSVELYDTDLNSWRPATPLPSPRTNHATVVLKGIVYVCGGIADSMKTSCVTYDPLTNSWDTNRMAPMLHARGYFGMVLLNGLIYAVGGHPNLQSIERYDPATNSWEQVSTNVPVRVAFCGVAATGGAIYVAGGQIRTNRGGMTVGTLYRYVPAEDSWVQLASMNTERRGLAMVPVTMNGIEYILAIGGIGQNGPALGTVEVYNIQFDKWEFLKSDSDDHPPLSLTMNRRDLSATVMSGSIYVAGGFQDDTILRCVERIYLNADFTGRVECIASMMEAKVATSLVALKIPKT